jgi:hypothetical protein
LELDLLKGRINKKAKEIEAGLVLSIEKDC